ncbi:rhomboid family intramembrane serine protease [Filimonas effusa]|uniref:Rhomboid family intramembrane serine protease n=1 Tax=Filimonas effusa TaxID=2508721 RepID=A0A4Q1D1H1_9BACT|nr:rhomboid family intramembrane serine protease [Filimonas effusa]RXK80941.1 rhomboid family intramembrane serine protease [Filimonas effusa]
MGLGIVTLLLIIANCVISYQGFKSRDFIDKYRFEVEKVLLYKDYKCIVTSGFIHANWTHLILNMLGLFFIGQGLEAAVGPFEFLLIYFAGLIGGDLLSLLVHKKHGNYSSLGASGAIGGIFFAFIALFPSSPIRLFLIPISFPAWIFGLAYVVYSIYGIHSRKQNIGHESHLGGALVGMFTAIIFHPSTFLYNYWAVLIIAIPAVVFIYIIVTRPHVLLIDNYFFRKQKPYYSIDEKYNQDRTNKQHEIDDILDKIGKKGINSLTKEEKRKLEEYSRS